jgi:hypothetical protein
MDICEKYGLLTEDHDRFCERMMLAARDGLPDTATVADFLDRLKSLEKELSGLLSFSLSSELGCLRTLFTPEAPFREFLGGIGDGGCVSRAALDFSRSKRFEALDSVLSDPSCGEEERAERVRELFASFARRERRFYRLRHASVAHAKEIRRLCDKLPSSHDDVLREIDLGRRISFTPRERPVVPRRQEIGKKKTTRIVRNETVIRLRPWVSFDRVEAAEEGGAFRPLSDEFVDACASGVCRQEGEILRVVSGGEEKEFRVRYLADGVWKSQDEEVFAAEEAWLRGNPSVPCGLLDRLPPSAEYRACLVDMIRECLASVLTPAFRMDEVMALVAIPLRGCLSARDLAYRAYEIVGRLDPREPWARHHRSLPEKLRGCLLRFDRLAEAGHGVLFPEAEDPGEGWIGLRDRFFWKTMKKVVGDDVRVRPIPPFRGAEPCLGEAGTTDVRDDDGTLTDVSLLEEEDVPDVFEADHVVFGGVEAFGVFCETPRYYYTGGSDRPAVGSEPEEEEEIGPEHLVELLDELEEHGGADPPEEGDNEEEEEDSDQEDDEDDDEENPSMTGFEEYGVDGEEDGS